MTDEELIGKYFPGILVENCGSFYCLRCFEDGTGFLLDFRLRRRNVERYLEKRRKDLDELMKFYEKRKIKHVRKEK